MTPTGSDERASALISELLDLSGAQANRDLLRDILVTSLDLAHIDASRLDLKIAASALAEMGRAFDLFSRYRGIPKLTMFGSARTLVSDPLYAQAVDLAARMARENWLVVTGAGPGIMAAGADGAGPEKSLGVEIRLPFETISHPQLAAEGRVVEMKYFFTRKLMLMKESSAFAVLPGGFGTLDESFELFTLLQTGKAEPAPIVLLDLPGDPYWEGLERFLQEVMRRGLVDREDGALYRITDDVGVAVEEILGFYRNYHSRRFVGSTMVIRCRYAPTDKELAALNYEFADICTAKGIWRTGPLPPERAGRDHLELKRIALEFDRRSHGRLRMLIDAINRWPPRD
ncbi:MAG: TIGR00730 family Rossman fold protein [Acidimicrobiales bacterium]